MNTALAEATCQMVIWKNDPVMTYAVGFVLAAHGLALKGLPCGSDDVPDEYQPSFSPGVAGSAIAMLREANVINDCFDTLPDLGIHGGRRKSKRESANGRKISTYRVTSLAAAEEFLKRNGIVIERQMRLL